MEEPLRLPCYPQSRCDVPCEPPAMKELYDGLRGFPEAAYGCFDYGCFVESPGGGGALRRAPATPTAMERPTQGGASTFLGPPGGAARCQVDSADDRDRPSLLRWGAEGLAGPTAMA